MRCRHPEVGILVSGLSAAWLCQTRATRLKGTPPKASSRPALPSTASLAWDVGTSRSRIPDLQAHLLHGSLTGSASWELALPGLHVPAGPSQGTHASFLGRAEVSEGRWHSQLCLLERVLEPPFRGPHLFHSHPASPVLWASLWPHHLPLHQPHPQS